MKPRYRLYRRHRRIFYVLDRLTGKRESLETADKVVATRLLHARNDAQQQPLINRQIARAYLAVGDPEFSRRTWRTVINEIIKLKHGPTRQRWINASKDKSFSVLLEQTLSATQADHFLQVLGGGPKKSRPLNWAVFYPLLRHLNHGRVRTQGTWQLYKRFPDALSRRQLAAPARDYRQNQLHFMKRIHWRWAGLAWSCDATEYGPDGSQISAVQDLASRYRLRPLVTDQ